MSYNEVQRFKAKKIINWVLGLILSGFVIVLIYALNEKIHNAPLIVSGGFFLIILLLLLFNKANLKTSYSESGIKYSFFSFTSKEQAVELFNMKTLQIKNIDPLGDFGGYGLRFKGKTVAYVLPSRVIEITLNIDKSIILSIVDPDKIQLFIDKYFKEKNDKASLKNFRK